MENKKQMNRNLDELKPLRCPNGKDLVSIVLSSDANYEPHLWVTISSIIDNAKSNFDYYIYILDGGICNKEVFFELISKDNRFHIEFINMKDQFVFVYESRHISRAGYYRLALFRLFRNFEKLIYIDADSYVLGDIAELTKLPMGDKSIAGAKDSITYEKPWREKYISYPLYSGKSVEYFTQYLKLSKEKLKNYFSSGILVFNLEKIDCKEKDRKLQKLLLKDYYCHDQDILNLLFDENETYTLPREWNYFNSATVLKPADFIIEEEKKNYLEGKVKPKIVSYVLKPWKKEYVNSPYADLYWKKLESSPYYIQVKEYSEKNTKLNRFMRLTYKEKIQFLKRYIQIEK